MKLNKKLTAVSIALAAGAVAPLAEAKVCSYWPGATAGYDDSKYKAFTDDTGTATFTAYPTDYTDTAQYNADLYFADHLSEPSSVSGYDSIATYFAHKMGIMAASSTWKAYDFGWEDWGDPKKAMARTLNGFYVAWASHSPGPSSWSDTSGPVLNFALGHIGQAFSAVDDLRGGCTSNSGLIAHSQWDVLGFGDEYTILYPAFFYRFNAVRRAASLFHEARHKKSSKKHTAEDMEKKWYLDDPNFPSIYAWEVLWLVSYYQDANVNTYKTYRNWAKYAARDLAATKFQQTNTIPVAIRAF